MAERKLERHIAIERSIIKKYRKTIWNNFVAAVQEYELIEDQVDEIDTAIEDAKNQKNKTSMLKQQLADRLNIRQMVGYR